MNAAQRSRCIPSVSRCNRNDIERERERERERGGGGRREKY